MPGGYVKPKTNTMQSITNFFENLDHRQKAVIALKRAKELEARKMAQGAKYVNERAINEPRNTWRLKTSK